MARTTERECIAVALFAVADMRGKLYLSDKDAERFESYGRHIQSAVVSNYETAVAWEAYVIDRPFAGRSHGWRLCRFSKGGGQSDVSPVMTAGAFADAMRTVSAMCREKGGR